MHEKVTTQGRFTIPAAIRRNYGINPSFQMVHVIH